MKIRERFWTRYYQLRGLEDDKNTVKIVPQDKTVWFNPCRLHRTDKTHVLVKRGFVWTWGWEVRRGGSDYNVKRNRQKSK